MPCENGGNCTNTGATFTCACREGYVGRTCDEIEEDDDEDEVNDGAGMSFFYIFFFILFYFFFSGFHLGFFRTHVYGACPLGSTRSFLDAVVSGRGPVCARTRRAYVCDVEQIVGELKVNCSADAAGGRQSPGNRARSIVTRLRPRSDTRNDDAAAVRDHVTFRATFAFCRRTTAARMSR